MPFVTVGQENSQDIKLHFEDHGTGEIILMIHGYPFSGTAWEKEEAVLLNEGYRVITYDRRGFGLSSRPAAGYDYDTFAKDLDALLTELDLHDVCLVGHSMGTGEIARYLSTYGSDRISRAVFIAPIPPFLLKTAYNENGVEQEVFDGFKKAIDLDRYAFITDFLKKFYNTSKLLGKPISDEKIRADFNLASISSPIAFSRCVDTWLTDFRDDLSKITIPCHVIQGDADEILPFDITGKLLAEKLNCSLKVIPGGSHGIPWTHADIISEEILTFMRQDITAASRPAMKKKSDRSASLH